jgi:hypothetical protein
MRWLQPPRWSSGLSPGNHHAKRLASISIDPWPHVCGLSGPSRSSHQVISHSRLTTAIDREIHDKGASGVTSFVTSNLTAASAEAMSPAANFAQCASSLVGPGYQIESRDRHSRQLASHSDHFKSNLVFTTHKCCASGLSNASNSSNFLLLGVSVTWDVHAPQHTHHQVKVPLA